ECARADGPVEDDRLEAVFLAEVTRDLGLEVGGGVVEVDRRKFVRNVTQAADLGLGGTGPIAVEGVVLNDRVEGIDQLDTVRSGTKDLVVAYERGLRRVIHKRRLDRVVPDRAGGARLEWRATGLREWHR